MVARLVEQVQRGRRLGVVLDHGHDGGQRLVERCVTRHQLEDPRLVLEQHLGLAHLAHVVRADDDACHAGVVEEVHHRVLDVLVVAVGVAGAEDLGELGARVGQDLDGEGVGGRSVLGVDEVERGHPGAPPVGVVAEHVAELPGGLDDAQVGVEQRDRVGDVLQQPPPPVGRAGEDEARLLALGDVHGEAEHRCRRPGVVGEHRGGREDVATGAVLAHGLVGDVAQRCALHEHLDAGEGLVELVIGDERDDLAEDLGFGPSEEPLRRGVPRRDPTEQVDGVDGDRRLDDGRAAQTDRRSSRVDAPMQRRRPRDAGDPLGHSRRDLLLTPHRRKP